MREIVFPEAKSFSDIFPVVTTDKSATEPVRFERQDWRYTPKGNRSKRMIPVEIGPWCGIHDRGGYRSLYVHPTSAVADYLARNWIGDGDGSFRVTVRDDGTALITAEYNQIIGSHWLALVDASTVPADTAKEP